MFCDFKGEISGERGKSSYCEKWFTLLSVAVKNGLFHPNCRHTLSTYIDGVTSIPQPIDGQVIKKQRELEQRQRAMERKIRRLKRLVSGTFDESRLKAYKSQLRLAQSELKAFVSDHSDILRRDYSREKVYDIVDKSEKSVIIKDKLIETVVNDVHSIGKIDIEKYKCITEDIQTDEVIITDRQIEHIKERHPDDYERYFSYAKEIVQNPDYILEANKPNTAFILKHIEDNGKNYQLILRLKTSQDPNEYKNSIITFLKVDDKKWAKYLRNKKILYDKNKFIDKSE